MAVITPEEKLRRRQSIESVLGTNAMEGLFPDESTLAIFREYEAGVLALDEFSLAMDRHAHQLLAAQGKMAGAA